MKVGNFDGAEVDSGQKVKRPKPSTTVGTQTTRRQVLRRRGRDADRNARHEDISDGDESENKEKERMTESHKNAKRKDWQDKGKHLTSGG